MEILPAIDLLGAQIVRLSQGDYDRPKEYSSVPGSVARELISAGAKWIHVVDLDAARSGQPTNLNEIRTIRKIAREAGSKIELGGGARDKKTIVFMQLELADRVVVGSAALKDWKWFEGLLDDSEVPNQGLALGLDARQGRLAIHGWRQQDTVRPAGSRSKRALRKHDATVCHSSRSDLIYRYTGNVAIGA